MSDELSVPLEKLTGPDEDFGPDEYSDTDGAAGSGTKPMPELPDGIGLSYDDIKLLLTMKHKTSPVEDNEPMLMMVSVCNAFLGEASNLHQRHNEALSKIIAGKTQEYISGVKECTDAFTRTLADASVEGVRLIFEKHAATLEAHRGNTRWCACIVALSALANIIVLGLR
jgi:hypothetical protein